jgi:hypothetical protein
MGKISITRALSEVKTIGERIDRKIREAQFVTIAKDSETFIHGGMPKNKFEQEVGSSMASISAMFARLTAIKGAIAEANAKTTVVVAGKTYTVVQAIEAKKVMELKKKLLRGMRDSLESHTTRVTDVNIKVDVSLDRLVTEMVKATDKDRKSSTITEFCNEYRKQNAYSVYDPCNIRQVASNLADDITGFLGEIDFVLSESNSKTEIEIAD